MKYCIPLLFALILGITACGTEDDSQSSANTTNSESSETTADDTEESNEAGNTTDGDSERVGTSATSCGDPIQGLEPVDCTMHGDTDAFCVYGNHCYCNRDAGFQCEAPLMDDWDECEPGSTCVPIE